MSYKDIARIIPTIQAATLAQHNLKLAKKKKKKAKDIIGTGVTNIVGTSLLKMNADLIES